MSLGNPGPLTSLASGIAGGFRDRQRREELERSQRLKERQLNIQEASGARDQSFRERQVTLQESAGIRNQNKADLELIGNTAKLIRGTSEPAQRTQIFEDFGKSPAGKKALERFNLQDIQFSTLPTGEDIVSGAGIVTDKNKNQLEKIATQIHGVPIKLQAGDTYEFERGAKKQSFDFEAKEGKGTSKLSDDVRKAMVRMQESGGKVAQPGDEKFLPPQAFTTLGLGEDSIRMRRPANKLPAEAASKFALAESGKRDAKSLLKQINEDESGKFFKDAILGSLPGLGKIINPIVNTQILNISEGIGRALSGAGVPASEVVRFITLFSIQPFDNKESIQFKLKRSIKIIDDLKVLMSFGSDISTFIDEEALAMEELNNSLQQPSETPGQEQVPQQAQPSINLPPGVTAESLREIINRNPDSPLAQQALQLLGE